MQGFTTNELKGAASESAPPFTEDQLIAADLAYARDKASGHLRRMEDERAIRDEFRHLSTIKNAQGLWSAK